MTKRNFKLPASFRTTCHPMPRSMAHTTLALSLGSVMMVPLTAHAADQVIVLDQVTVEGRSIDTNPYAEPGAPYKARLSGDARHKRPIAELIFTHT